MIRASHPWRAATLAALLAASSILTSGCAVYATPPAAGPAYPAQPTAQGPVVAPAAPVVTVAPVVPVFSVGMFLPFWYGGGHWRGGWHGGGRGAYRR